MVATAITNEAERAIVREYNGYTNYPTWNVMLWIDNEEWSYTAAVNLARRGAPKSDAVFGRLVKRFILEYLRDTADPETSAYADIKGWANAHGKRVTWAINRINFGELAEHLREYATH